METSGVATRRLAAALGLWAALSATMGLINVLAAQAGGDDDSPWMMAAGLLMVGFAFPVLCIGLPLFLAARWGLERGWWPPREHLGRALAVVLLYTVLTSYAGLAHIFEAGVAPGRFIIHFFAAALFHVPYYALFGALLLPAARRVMGPARAVALTSAAFSLFHLSTFHFFPDGTRPLFLVLLFFAFTANLLVYLYTRSLLLTALSHCVNGAVGLASEGTLFDEVDFVFVAAMLTISGMVAWALVDHVRLRRAGAELSGYWLEARLR